MFNHRLSVAAQRDLSLIKMKYKNRTGQLTEVSLDKLTPEFILRNDYYFNSLRRNNVTGITADEFYHYP